MACDRCERLERLSLQKTTLLGQQADQIRRLKEKLAAVQKALDTAVTEYRALLAEDAFVPEEILREVSNG